MARIDAHDRLLADPFAVAVGIDRRGRIVFAVRVGGATAEDLVAADVEDRRADFGGRQRDVLRAEAVDANRLFRVAGAAVHVRPGGGMDDHVRLRLFDEGARRLKIGDVEFRRHRRR